MLTSNWFYTGRFIIGWISEYNAFFQIVGFLSFATLCYVIMDIFIALNVSFHVSKSKRNNVNSNHL